MDLRKFESQIRKTGFDLENRIAQSLREAGWTVISNKYYVDDFEESVREIDLVAYQAAKVRHFDLYTTLIISCKKSEANAWGLLARDLNVKDPNSDWWPLHAWSNDKAIQYELTQSGAARRYHDELPSLGVVAALELPAVEVFAFQEMDRNTGAAQNDRPIFTAITSLMKAQAYEMSALPLRKKSPAVYQFSLLSIVDTDLVRLKFSGSAITASEVDIEHYIARYIVKKKETFSRIRFIKASAFPAILPDYGRLHAANCKWFGLSCDAFYQGAVEDWGRTQVFLEDFTKAVKWLVRWRVDRQLHKTIDLDGLTLNWRASKNVLSLSASLDNDVIEFLNKDQEIKNHIAGQLKKIYRYEGLFIFDDDDIPF